MSVAHKVRIVSYVFDFKSLQYYGAQPLGRWCDIQATEEQLNALGVGDMKYVSGAGEYTLAFTAPKNWADCDGAIIAFECSREPRKQKQVRLDV